ncbi:MAG: hypothetical protein ISS35_04355 [Kiritimatiellae bacterium]|nr:hypothetical protein [Kiritimatiellia bacterium]
MAETVIGTAGIFFTLAMIAVLSFVVGLVIYGLYDYFHTMGRSRKHSHRRHSPALKTSPSELADVVHKAAEQAKRSLLARTVDDDALDPQVGWEVVVELQVAFIHAVEGALLPGMTAVQREVYRRVFRAISAETMAADLGAARPVNVFAMMEQRLAALSECHHAASGRLLHMDVVDRCEVAVRGVLGERIIQPDEFRTVLEDVISSAVTLDLVHVV